MFTSLHSKQNDQTPTTGASKPPQRTASSNKTIVKQPNPFEIMQRLRTNPASLTYNDINQLQKTIGNSATSQFIKELQDSQSLYTVKSGDTLGEIAENYHTTVEAIKNLNNIKDINMIYTGQKLKIPAATSKIPVNPVPYSTARDNTPKPDKSSPQPGKVQEKIVQALYYR